MNSNMFAETSIVHDGRRVALKWHRLRRRAGDPLFGADVLAEGLRLGASMEVDLRVTADGDFVVLHDDVLDDETNGHGPVAAHDRASLAGLRYDDAGVPGMARHARPLLFLDELAALLADAHPDALLQLDMKDEFATVGERGVDRFVDVVERALAAQTRPAPGPSPRTRAERVLEGWAPTPTTSSPRPSRGEGKGEGPGDACSGSRIAEIEAQRPSPSPSPYLSPPAGRGVADVVPHSASNKLPLIVSGDSSALILAIKARLPHIAHGIEPSFRLIDLFRKGDANGAVAQLRAELADPTEPQMVYLNWELILGALAKGIDLVAMCRDEGKKVDAWTFTLADPAGGFSDREWREFSQLLALGVDQITTDEATATARAYLGRASCR